MKRIILTAAMFLISMLILEGASALASPNGGAPELNSNVATRNASGGPRKHATKRGRVHTDARRLGNGAVSVTTNKNQPPKPNMNGRHHPPH